MRGSQQSAFEMMKTSLCQVLLAVKETKNFNTVPKRHYMQFCQPATLEEILGEKDLYTAFETATHSRP